MAPFKVRGLSVAAALLWVCCVAVLLSASMPAFANGGFAASVPSPVSGPPLGAGGHAQLAPLPDPPLLVPRVVASVGVGSEPEVGVTDLANGLVYVANSVSDNVSVLNGSSVVGTVDLVTNLSGTPLYLVYDNLSRQVYVVDRYDGEFPGFGAVNVINGTSVVATLAVGYLPDSAVFDPSNGYVYVTNSESHNVTVIDGTARIASPTVGTGPCAAAYDPSDGDVFVANAGSNNVSLLSGTSVVGSLPAGSGPSSVAYDPLDGDVYVANSLSDNVTIENANAVVGNVPVGSDPSFVAFNPTVGGVEVAATNSNDVTVLNGTAAVATVSIAAGPVWLGVDPFGVFTFVVGEDANAVTVLEGTTLAGNVTVGGLPTYGVADPLNQREYVVNSGSNNVSVFAVTYPVTFNETGLAPGVRWSVTLAGSVNSSSSPSIGFAEPSGAYGYSITTPSGYVFVRSDPSSPLSVANHGVTVSVTFAPVPSVPYNLTFVETGLGTGCSSRGGWGGGWGGGWEGPLVTPDCCKSSSPAWSVSVKDVTKTSTNSSIVFSEINGTYNYTVYPPSGYTVTSSVPPSPVTIDGANLTVNVTFVPVPSVPYSLTFVETGLGTGCSSRGGWDDGWGSDWKGPLGRPDCCKSSSPAWSVRVNNVTKTTTNSSIVFSETNGTYNYTVYPPSGYTVTSSVPPSPVTIDGGNLTVNVTFVRSSPPHPLSITLQEWGLHRGTVWCVTVNVTRCSSDEEIVFPGLSPGTYAFNVSALTGYTAQPSSGSITLTDRSVTVQVRFFSTGHHSCGGWDSAATP
jgi:YVTN family beta-propeller protein